MKNIKWILVILIMILQVNVLAADDATLTVECNKLKLLHGEETTCEVNATVLNNNYSGSTASIELEYSEGLEITVVNGDYFSSDLSNNQILLKNNVTETGTYKLGNIKIKVLNNASFGNKDITFTLIYSSTTTFEVDSVTKTINVLSDDNNLEKIIIDGVSLTNFDSKTLNYRFETENDKITIDALASSPTLAKVIGTGEKKVSYGENIFEIKVTSQAGNTKTYTLTVVKNDERSDINTLKSLELEGINFNFKSETTNYKINVESDISKIKITSTLTDNKASYVKDFGNREVSLAYGENKVLIKVKSEKGNIRTYTLTINRKDDRSDVAKLISLDINGSKIDIKDGVLEYNVTLHHKHNKTSVIAKANALATIDYKDINLEVGDNVLKIVVISEKETKVEYKINIKRLTLEESKVSLENIIVDGYELNFTKDVKDYNLKIAKDISTLNIMVLPDEEGITHSILGNNNLINGSIITINVRDDFGEYVYKINIMKDVETKLILGFLTIEQVCYIIFSIGALSFLCSVIYAIKRKKVK